MVVGADLTEEAVNEVKRQAVCELQKAVAAAEQKANELVSAEKQKMERSLADIRKQTREEVLSMVNAQEESSEVGSHCMLYLQKTKNSAKMCTDDVSVLHTS
jgi:runt-related transcription factor 1